MFNFSGSEIVFLLVLALIILGPEKLPDAIRSFGKTYAEFKKATTGFQSELKNALDEPMREMRETADALKQAASFDVAADMLEGKKPTVAAAAPAPDESADASGAAPPMATPEPKQMWTAHDAATPSTPAVIEGDGEPDGPDLSMLDSVVMDRDHTYQAPTPTEAASGEAASSDAPTADAPVQNGEADAS